MQYIASPTNTATSKKGGNLQFFSIISRGICTSLSFMAKPYVGALPKGEIFKVCQYAILIILALPHLFCP
jgi:hypothetical protein